MTPEPHEQEDIPDDGDTNTSPLDHLFSALKHFARAGASRGGGAAARAGKGDAPGAAARFGTVKKSCCLARKQQK